MNKNPFEVIPAIDILDGKCVRLTQGNYDQVENFSSDIEEVAQKWIDLGAKRLHIVDLNGAKEGYPVNFDAISNLTSKVKVMVQVGGGIRTQKSIKNYLDEGVDYVILGTKALTDRNFLKESLHSYKEKVIIGLDLRHNKIAVSGWQEITDVTIGTILSDLRCVKQIICTDISKDGTLSGPNLQLVKEVASHLGSDIIVSGGISSLEDIASVINLSREEHKNIKGVILGKSLYRGTVDLPSAINLARKY